jgi:hypothetical protein
MAAGSPIAALEPARPASPLKALSFWGAGLVQSRPPAFPANMSKLWASAQGFDFGLWARLSAITRARRWLMLGYRRRIWLRERKVPQGDGWRGGFRVPYAPQRPGITSRCWTRRTRPARSRSRRIIVAQLEGVRIAGGSPRAIDEQPLTPRPSPKCCASLQVPAARLQRRVRSAALHSPMPHRRP